MLEDENYLCCSDHDVHLTGIVYTCINNHNVCLKCYLRNKKCPVCRSLDYKRNTILEEKISKLTNDCKNIECSYKVLNGDEHHLYCKYKLIVCPICSIDIKYFNLITHLKTHYTTVNIVSLYTDDITSTIKEVGIYIINHVQSEQKKIILILDTDIKILYIDESENPTKTIISLVDKKYNTMMIDLPFYNNEIDTELKFTEIDLYVFIEYNFMVLIKSFDHDMFKVNSKCMIKKNNNVYRCLVLDHFYNPHRILVKYEFKIGLIYIELIEELEPNPNIIREEYPVADYTTEEYRTITQILNEEERIEFINSIPDRPGPF